MYIHIFRFKMFLSTWSWPRPTHGHLGAGCHRLRTDAGLSAGHGRGQGLAGDPLQRPRGFGLGMALGWPWDTENFGVSTSFLGENFHEFSRDKFLVGVVVGCFLEPILVCVFLQILEWSIGVWMPPWHSMTAIWCQVGHVGIHILERWA